MGANGCVGFLAAQDVGLIALPDVACKAAGVMEHSLSKSGFGEHQDGGDGELGDAVLRTQPLDRHSWGNGE